MEYINMDKRFKISKILIGNLIFLLLFALAIDETSSLGFDSATSCSPNAKQSRRGRAQMLAAIPCDLTTQAYCNLPGAAYPWHAVRRFVHENQGLMKRMYGDVRHISVLRDEIINNEIDVEDIEMAQDRYSRDGHNRRASKLMRNREDFDNFRANDVLHEPHFRPVTTTTTTTSTAKTPITTTEKLETTTDNNEIEKIKSSELEANKTSHNDIDTTTTISNELNVNLETNFKSKLLNIENDNVDLTTKTDFEKQLEEADTTVEDEEDDDVDIEFNSVYETPQETAAPQDTNGNNIEIVNSPQLGLNNITTDSLLPLTTSTKESTTTSYPSSSTTSKTTTTVKPETVAERSPASPRKPFVPSSQRLRPLQLLHKVDSTISAKLKLKTNPTQITTPAKISTTTLMTSINNETKTADISSPSSTTPLVGSSTKNSPFKSHLNKNYNRYTTSNSNRFALPTTSPLGSPQQALTPSVQPFKSNPELLLGEKLRKPIASATPSVTPAAVTSNKPVLKDSQLFQDTMKQEPVAAPTNARGVNACPVKEEVVAPFWANNTRGEVLALLNLYPFEQYVHWEKCTHEHKQMYCREGCRCEQQYRLHRLLAYDPHNECRGIFSDWFRFPSCCICKCYNIPLDFRATSRSPRSEGGGTSEYRHPIDAAEEHVKNAIYEHATEEWYRPKDEFDFYEG